MLTDNVTLRRLARVTPKPLKRALKRSARSVGSATRTAYSLAHFHGWLRIPAGRQIDVAVKPGAYLPVYEEFLSGLRLRRIKLLELGIWKGDSLALWRDAFPRAIVIGVDLAPPNLDFGRRVIIVTGDQSDPQLLTGIRQEHAPGGFDVIIDDASHIGELSARSLQALFVSHLKPGGLYIIEDWGTGYMSSWPGGGEPSAIIGASALDGSPDDQAEDGSARRMPSHDAGMVGLVKRLVDHTAAGTLGVHQPQWIDRPLPIEWMRVQDGLVILKKAR